MAAQAGSPHSGTVLEVSALGAVFEVLREQGHVLLGPRVRDGAIVYDEIESAADLPVGWTDVQEAGHYRLAKRDDRAHFGFVVGPQSWKKFLFAPRQRLYRLRKGPERDFTVEPEVPRARKKAFIGVRGCELAAIAIQDGVFTGGEFEEPHYRAARRETFLLGLNCVGAAPTCFCTSMGTGPRARGSDLSLTEVVTEEHHFFLVTEASQRGRVVLSGVPHRPASPEELELAHTHEGRARDQARKVDTHFLAEAIASAQAHPRWDDVAERCLSCANCTMVCPTCFCSTVEDVVDLTGENAERWRRWDSCFTGEFTALHGRPVRSSTRSRYRHWLTHKLSTWHAQFDSSGCVGCGRCITWCPVGIDITAEAAALSERAPPGDDEIERGPR